MARSNKDVNNCARCGKPCAGEKCNRCFAIPDGMVSSNEVLVLLGITYRQLDYWSTKLLNRRTGSGKPRNFDSDEVLTLANIWVLAELGLKPGTALEVAGSPVIEGMDWNAPYNPYSYTFQSDMPPDMVKEIESCGWYWGGRYEGQKYDAMHYGYCWTPGDVAGHVAKAKSLLSGVTPPDPDDGDDDVGKIFYKVYRMNEVDYVAAPGHFRAITSPDDYHFMASTGWIDVPHGEAPKIERNLLEYIRNEAAKGANPGGIEDIIN